MTSKKKSGFFSRTCILYFLLTLAVLHPAFSQTALSYYETGKNQQDDGDFFNASISFREAIRVNPSYSLAHFSLAQCSFEMGEYTLALDHLTQAEKFLRDKTDTQNLRAFIYVALSRLNEANTIFSNVLKQFPNNIDARFGLAILDIYNGRILQAEQTLLEILKRQNTERRALTALALIYNEQGKLEKTDLYISNALRYHSGNASVHYFASYIALKNNNLQDAEREIKVALSLMPNYDEAYKLLSDILLKNNRYTEALDICEYRIRRNRQDAPAWYLRGLLYEKLGNTPESLRSFESALLIDNHDEITRAALESMILDELGFEDRNRKKWADYHSQKAAIAQASFNAAKTDYEFRRSLLLDPLNTKVRNGYADVMLSKGLRRRYLNQLKFIAEESSSPSTLLNDLIEGYESVLTDSILQKWKIDPVFIEKKLWQVGIFYTNKNQNNIHEEAERIVVRLISDAASSGKAQITASNTPVSGYSEAFRIAKRAGMDYFVLLGYEENVDEVRLTSTIYTAVTGEETAKINVYRNGNDRVSESVMRFTDLFNAVIPSRGNILARNGNSVVIDMGKVDKVSAGTVFKVVSKIAPADKGQGVRYNESDVLGELLITKADEEISEGTLQNIGFYDKIASGNTVLQKTDETSTDAGTANMDSAKAQTLKTPALAKLASALR